MGDNYAVICFFCLLIQGIVLLKKLFGSSRNNEDVLFIAVIVSVMLYSLSDGLWGLESIGVIKQTRNISYLLNCTYYCLTCIMVFMWSRYAQYSIKSRVYFANKFIYVLGYLPLFIIFVLSIMSYWNGSIFYIEGIAIYHRGPLFVLQQIVCYYYLIIETLIAIYKANRPENYPDRMKYYTIASFPIFPTLSIPLYLLIPNCPGLTMGVTLGCIQAIVFGLSVEISSDNLTGVGNKRSLIRYIKTCIGNEKYYDNLHLILIDLDDFHFVNDHYGHIEGDRILMETSKCLVSASRSYNCHVYRYGGDEFALLIKTKNPIYIDRLMDEVFKAVNDAKNEGVLPRGLSYSFGLATFSDKHKEILNFMDDAEREVLKAKINRE